MRPILVLELDVPPFTVRDELTTVKSGNELALFAILLAKVLKSYKGSPTRIASTTIDPKIKLVIIILAKSVIYEMFAKADKI
jgi:hypothetical protein